MYSVILRIFSFSSIQYNYIMQIRLKCKHYINTFLYSIFILHREPKSCALYTSLQIELQYDYIEVYTQAPNAKFKPSSTTQEYTPETRDVKKTYISVQSNLVMEAELQNFLKFTCVFFLSLLLLLLCVFFCELLFAFQTEYRILRICWSFVLLFFTLLGELFFSTIPW